jgi:hypothetical protein
MALDMSAGRPGASDVSAAILEVDSTLKRINGTATSSHADLNEALVSSPAEAADLLDGFCTLMYLFILSAEVEYFSASVDSSRQTAGHDHRTRS